MQVTRVYNLMRVLLVLGSVLLTANSNALLSLELTQGLLSGLPIAVVPFINTNPADVRSKTFATQISTIIYNDLVTSGRFKVTPLQDISPKISNITESSWPYVKKLGVDNIVIGKITPINAQEYRVSFQLLDVFATPAFNATQTVILNRNLHGSAQQIRQLAHHISDAIYEKIFNIKGIFSTRLAYIVVRHTTTDDANHNQQVHKSYALEVADADGANPRTILLSTDPVMSPAWSKDGKQLAYVSFEKKQAAIYIQNILTGARQLVSRFPGINGAPAWSPDGHKLAVVLSMGVNPNIYVFNLDSKKLTTITHDAYLNTEPAWSPDGKNLFFTSTRSGGPQIYQYNLAHKAITQITTNGSYNARASLTADGRRIVAIHKEHDAFSIAIFDLDTGAMRILTPPGTTDSSSPSVAPNGSMVLYDTVLQGKNMLAMVSTDGRIQIKLPDRDGQAQDPAWSPFLT